MYDLTIFFYDGRDHCHRSEAASQGKATVCGKLYLLPPDSPTLVVPLESIILTGTRDAFESAQEQYLENSGPDQLYKIHDGWDTVHGELVTFSDPEEDLPELDKQFRIPLYFDRVLIPARKADGSIIAAWTYIMYDIHFTARRLPAGRYDRQR